MRTCLEQLRAGDDGRVRLVVLDGVNDAAVAAEVAAVPTRSVICIGGTETELPSVCDAVVVADYTNGPRLRVRSEVECDDDIAADLMSLATAERVSRALCPLRDAAGAAGVVPATVTWSQLHD